ncbi:MAG: pantetheine-phosphate adenylyltransferase [Rhodospirillales bacterium]|nr:pantetheine-phosphate adenylyltransferase [Rhodospirillales bacterium]
MGVYPGTFDPVTKGHLHLIRRASKLVDRLTVAVADSPRKGPLFTLEERLDMLRTDIANMHDKHCPIEVQSFNNLLVHYARDIGASFIFRGLRAVSDFEFEFKMTGMNARLAPDIETVFLTASDKWQFVSSSVVKEVCSLGGDVSEVVTPAVEARLKEKFAK